VGGREHAAALRGGVRLLGQAIAAWWRDDGLRLGAALSDYTAFSLAPVLSLSVAISKAKPKQHAGWRHLLLFIGAELSQVLCRRRAVTP